jgi:hypothetical protein
LQCILAEPITDPAEQAAIDKMRKQLKQQQREQEAATARSGVKKTASKSTARKRA